MNSHGSHLVRRFALLAVLALLGGIITFSSTNMTSTYVQLFGMAFKVPERSASGKDVDLPSDPVFNSSIQRIYTIGIPRTGSTFQAVLLCVIAHLRSTNVACHSELPASLQVIKAHNFESLISDRRANMIFLTVREDLSDWHNVDRAHLQTVAYVQRYAQFQKCHLCEIEHYAKIFHLSDDEVLQLRQYMRYWSILRQCCGSQASKLLRAKLFGCGEFNTFEIEGAFGFHECHTRNLTAVEQAFVSTHLYKLVSAEQLVPTSQHKLVWVKPGDCAASHEAAATGTGFNLVKMDSNFCLNLANNV